jgi:hypothetical protein
MKRFLPFICLWLAGASSLFSQTDKLNPIFFAAMSRRVENGSAEKKTERLMTSITPSTNIKITFSKDVMRGAMVPGNPDSVQNKMRVLNSYIGVLQKERDENLSRLRVKADSQKVSDQYAEKIRGALGELAEIQNSIAAMMISVKGVIIFRSGRQVPLDIPNYAQAVRSDSDYSLVTKSRVFTITGKGDLADDVVDTEIDLAGENLSEGDQVRIVVENFSRNSVRQFINYFRIEPVGWGVEFRPCLEFIKRAKDPGHTSNFKPAPGASLLYSFASGGTSNEKLWKNFSVGVNAALVDFDAGKTMEAGIGFVGYGLNSSIGLGYGWNVHTHSKKGYYMLTFDLLRLFQTVRDHYHTGS